MYDAIVIGLGAMGSATLFELARRGKNVLGLEQFSLVHDLGSSHGHTRIIRKAYFEHPSYVPLVSRAYERWYELEQRTGRHLLTECGCLNVGFPDGDQIQGVLQASREHGILVEPLQGEALARRFPPFRFSAPYVALYEPEAGFLYVEDCVRALLEEAGRLGAEIHDQEPVIHFQPTQDGVEVQTGRQRYRARSAVISAGAWAGRLLADLGLPLTVRRKPLFWFETPGGNADFRRDRFPLYIATTPGGVYYGFPSIDARGHKMARHDEGVIVEDPAQVDRTATEADALDCREFLARHLPGANGRLNFSKVCLYTLTPDCHFLIDLHPRYPQIALAAGFSGHGFKFASAVGEALADLALERKTRLPIELFRLVRLREKSQLAR